MAVDSCSQVLSLWRPKAKLTLTFAADDRGRQAARYLLGLPCFEFPVDAPARSRLSRVIKDESWASRRSREIRLVLGGHLTGSVVLATDSAAGQIAKSIWQGLEEISAADD